MGYGELDTPSVIVDLDVLERNIAEMAAVAAAEGVRLRPHIKTHKSPRIARMQLDAGAVGITCAKLGEAEAMADGGITDIFICYPLVTEQKVRRLAALARRPGMAVSTIVDSPEGVAALASIFAREPAPLEVLIKVDTGLGRVGVAPGEATVALAQQVAVAPGLRFGGICMHEGQTYKYPDSEERAEAGRAAARTLVATARMLDGVGLSPARVSSGSTPGGLAAASIAGITEMRPGNYAFYDAMQVGLDVVPPERCALRVLVTVVSHTARERAVMDAGSKTLTSDTGVHGMTGSAGHGIVIGKEDIQIVGLSEEHGWLKLDPRGSDVRIGEMLEVIPVHSCPVANLAGELVMVRGGAAVDRWPVAAAGRVM